GRIKELVGEADVLSVEERMHSRRRALVRLATGALLVVAAVNGVIGSVAVLAAQASNPSNAFATTSLYAPSSLTATPSGHDVALAWTAGQNGSGYGIKGVANGSSSDCSAAVYANLGTSASTTYTDAGRFTPQGTYFCYQA